MNKKVSEEMINKNQYLTPFVSLCIEHGQSTVINKSPLAVLCEVF